jgi:acyl carrier protein
MCFIPDSIVKFSFLPLNENFYLCTSKLVPEIRDPNLQTMTKVADIDGKVRAIIADKLGVDEKEITPQASFTNDLGADSLDTVELIMEFEKEFNIAIPDEQAEKISTVGEAIEYIKKNIK